MKRALIVGVLAAGLAGCQSTTALTPQATTALTEAYQVLCGPSAPSSVGGLVGVASASSVLLNPTQRAVLMTAEGVCGAGMPTNEIVAGVDLFTILSEVEALLPKKR
ncbi:MAG: hypothetical protein KGI08_07005 [Thaumarchaeota archaeon]|nr:hypothetical protein [Nitrososphaerota archaeon]